MSIIFFLLVFLAPLGVYLLNAYNARRPTGIAGGVEPAKKAKKAETPKPRRAKATVTRPAVARDCGRTWAHLCLALVGGRDACRWCETERREPSGFLLHLYLTDGTSEQRAATFEIRDRHSLGFTWLVEPASATLRTKVVQAVDRLVQEAYDEENHHDRG